MEIFNRTIKRKIIKYITEFNKENILDVLSQIIDTYNSTPNGGILFRKPIDIYMEHNLDKFLNFRGMLYKWKSKQIGVIKAKFSIGDTVRIKAATRTFSRAIDTINTPEIFKVSKVLHTIPPTYKITDLENEPILGSFYNEELTRVIDSEYYDINILKKRTRKGKKEFLVQFINYPTTKPRWIQENDLKAN